MHAYFYDKLDSQLQLKFCQVLIGNEINSRQSILYLNHRLIVIISTETFLHESCNSAFHYQRLEVAFYIRLQYSITRLPKMLFYPKHSISFRSVLRMLGNKASKWNCPKYSFYHKQISWNIQAFSAHLFLIKPLQTEGLLLPSDALFRRSTHTIKSSFVDPMKHQLHIKHWERFSLP